jgi:dihydropteroate synthase
MAFFMNMVVTEGMMTSDSPKGNSGAEEGTRRELIWKAGPHIWSLERRALVMAILNVTPDSFSDGGLNFQLTEALSSARRFAAEGADIIDLGGESTRPGAAHISPREEAKRVIPVIEKLAKEESPALSIDTRKPEVARLALQAGVHIVNDVGGFRDPAMVEACASSDCGLVVMHMKGTPETMQANPRYLDVVAEVEAFFEERLHDLSAAGIARERIALDPGIGFGKTLEHNLALLQGISRFCRIGRPVLIGLSRKSFLGTLLDSSSMDDREAPTQALGALTRRFGAVIHRVHQVRECREALRMMESLL